MSESAKSIVPRHLPSTDDNQMPDDGVKTPDVLAKRYRFIRRIGQGSQGNNEDISVIVDAMMNSRRVIDGTVTKRLRDGTIKSNSYQHLIPIGTTIALPDTSGVTDFSCTEKTMEVWTFDRNDSLICSRFRK